MYTIKDGGTLLTETYLLGEIPPSACAGTEKGGNANLIRSVYFCVHSNRPVYVCMYIHILD